MRQAIIELLKVKSIITLAIVGSMVYMACTRMIDSATFTAIAGSVITYYFNKDNNMKNGYNGTAERTENKFINTGDGERHGD